MGNHATSFYLAFVGGALACHGAWAQTLPSSADPSRILAPNTPTLREFDVKPRHRPADNTAPAVVDGALRPFVLHSIDLSGATAFDAKTLRPLYADYLGKTVDAKDLATLLDRLRQHYREAGYTISTIDLPKQNLADGHLRLQVTEGFIGHVAVDPAIARAPIIDGFIAQITAMRPLSTRRLERLMLILNARTDLSVAAILSPPTSPNPEAGEVTLSLQPRPIEERRSFISADNHGSNFTGPLQLSAGTLMGFSGLNYSDLFVGLTATMPLREMKQVAFEYSVPLWGASGTVLRVNGSANRTQPGENLAALGIEGHSENLGVSLSYPLVFQRDENWLVTAGLAYKNIRTDIANSRLFDDKLRVANLSTRYSFSDLYDGMNRAQLSISQGLDIMGARKSGAADLSRREGRSDFTKVEVNASRLQALPHNLGLQVSLRAQHSNAPLLSAEEFGFGGATIGRGYDHSEITGDRGIEASAELHYNHRLEEYQANLQPYAFYDIGKVWNIDPSDTNQTSAASAGVGLRAATDNGWVVDANAAVPLTKPADAPPPYANGNSPRVLISLKRSF